MGDTYHNRYSSDSPYKGNKKFKKKAKKCSVCGTTTGPFDLHHTSNNRKDLKSGKGLKVMCRSCHRKYHAKLNGGKGELIISTAARIIKDPQTSESQAIASSHKNSDLMHIEFILCHANTNGNKDTFTSDDLSNSASTAVYKPINWEHKNKNIGTIYESKFVSVKDLNAEAKAYYKDIDEKFEHDFVVCRAAVWEYKYPFESRIMRDRAEAGSLYFSMENKFAQAKCSECNEVYESAFDYCDHLLNRRQEGNASRIFINSNFVGSAVTSNPADKGASTLALANMGSENLIFSNLLSSNIMKTMNLMEAVAYVIERKADMQIRNIEIPSDLQEDNSELTDEAFADDTNRVFPIDSSENIEVSASLFLNNDWDFYNNEEKLFIAEKIAIAAKEYDIDIQSFINNDEGGNNLMTIDKNSPEFKTALAEELDKKLADIESGDRIKELERDLSSANTSKADLESTVTSLTEEKDSIKTSYDEFKESIDREKLVEARLGTLNEKGFAFEKNAETVKANLSKMDEDAFNSFVDTLEETRTLSEAKFQKKEDETKDKDLSPEEKKKLKDKENKAKASIEDPVKDSDIAVANKVDDDEVEDQYSTIDAVFKEAL